MSRLLEITRILMKDVFSQRRNFFVMLAIGFGAFFLVVGGAYNKGMQAQLSKLRRDFYTGDVMIVSRGIKITSSPNPLLVPLDRLVFYNEENKEKLRKFGIEESVGRLVVMASVMGESETESVFCTLLGVDMNIEETYSFQQLSFEENKREIGKEVVYISKKVAQKLGLKQGDPLYLFVIGTGGFPFPIKLRVGGIFEGKGFPAIVENLVYMEYEKLCDVLRIEKGKYSFLLCYTKKNVQQILLGLREEIGEKYDVLTPEEGGKFFSSIRKASSFFTGISFFLQYLITFLFIYSTLLVSINNRKKEIGVMMSLGLTRKGIFSFFVSEGFLIAFVPSVLFSIAGLGVVLVGGVFGIPALNEAMRYMFASDVLYLRIDERVLLNATFGFGLIGMVGAVFAVGRLLGVELLKLLRE